MTLYLYIFILFCIIIIVIVALVAALDSKFKTVINNQSIIKKKFDEAIVYLNEEDKKLRTIAQLLRMVLPQDDSWINQEDIIKYIAELDNEVKPFPGLDSDK